MSLRPLTIVVLALALAAAVLSALVGIAVLRTASDTREHRVVAASAPGEPDPDVRERGLATRIGESLLGVADDRVYYDAVILARSAGLTGQPASVVAERRAQAEATLVPLVHEDVEPPLRSRAANLLGSLLLDDAKVAQQNPRRFLEQATGAFQDAVLADPSNVAAKRNLELLTTVPLRTLFEEQSSPGTDASASGGESGY